MRELRIDDVKAQPGELLNATGKVSFLLDQIAGCDNKDVFQWKGPRETGVAAKDSEPLFRFNLSPIRDKYNLGNTVTVTSLRSPDSEWGNCHRIIVHIIFMALGGKKGAQKTGKAAQMRSL